MIRIGLRDARSHFGRFIMSIVAIALGVSFVVGSFCFREMLNNQVSQMMSTNADHDVYVRGSQEKKKDSSAMSMGSTKSYNDVDVDLAGTIAKVDGVSSARVVHMLSGVVLLDKHGDAVTTMGSPTLAIGMGKSSPWRSAKFTTGTWPKNGDEIALHSFAAEQSGLKVGDKTKIVYPDGAHKVTVSGIFTTDASQAGAIIIAIDPVTAKEKASKQSDDPDKTSLISVYGNKTTPLDDNAQQQLASGVTTVRGAGDPLFADLAVRDAIDAGKYQGPRLVAPGTGITVPGGHGAGLFAQVANSPAEAAEQVRDLYARGADVIKLFVTGGVFDAAEVGEPGVLRMPVEVAAAACKAAHDMGLPVMAHVESTEGVKAALEAGVDTIEHGAPLTPEILELYRGAAGTQLEGRAPSVTCTISPALPFVLLDPEKTHSTDTQKKNGDIVCSGIIESARAALEAGVKVGLGTDSSCPFVTQYDMWREVAYFAKYVGVSNAFALHTATQVNAELLGLGGDTGTIECGKAADILVTRKNPLDDLCALREPTHVMCRGDLVRKLKVKRIPEVDAELDAIMAMPAEALAEELARDGVV